MSMIPTHLRAARLLALSAFLLPFAGCTSSGPSGGDLGDARARTVAIVGATVIDGTGRAADESGVVVIEGDRIHAVGSAQDVSAPPGAEVIDATGRFLLPGFIDAHAHVALGPVTMGRTDAGPTMSMEVDPEVSRRSLPSLLGHGITTIRDPGGPADVLVKLRERVERGEVTGPQMRVAGDVIDQASFPGLVEQVRTPEEVRAAVRRQAQVGVDMIKLYTSLTPELLRAGIEEAHAHGLPAIAHLMATSWTQAAEMGIDGIVHIIPGSPGLLPADSAGELIESMRRGTQFMVRWFELVDYDAPAMAEAIQAVARNDVILDPTLVFFDALVRGDDPSVSEAPELTLAAPALVENWRGSFQMNEGWTDEDFRRGRQAFPKMLELARLLHEAGVTLAAGTDANNPWIVPGPSFHRELELLVEAGIPPEEVLVIATANGARAAGLLDDRGTIEPGKRADLVLVSRDPREDIRATRELRWVMQGGQRFDPRGLLRSVVEASPTEARDVDPEGPHE
jgi:imidazolonepropionase-like amidohydrolase